MAVIESARNPRLRSAMALRERRERDATGLTLVDGLRELGRALDAGVEVVEAFVDGDRMTGPDLAPHVARLRAAGADVHATAGDALARLAFGDRAEGVVAVVRQPPVALDALEVPAEPLLVVVEGLEKPGNLGAIVRSADGAGADAVIVADGLADPFNPNAIRASLGTIFALPVAAASSEDVLAFLRERGIRPVAALVDAPALYSDADLRGAVALVLGSEADGLGAAWRAAGIEAIRLPMAGIADSLNVSVTAAVLLYEARRQRRHATDTSAG